MTKMTATGIAFVLCLGCAATAGAQQQPKPRTKAPAQVRQQFARLDHNNDGVISRDEWKGKPGTFDRRDANHDGVISRAEFEHAGKAGKAKKKGGGGRD